MQKTGIDEFLALAHKYPVLDVRSPGEYAHAHIPGAYNLPLFTDEERKVVGTLYKQDGRATAIKTGLDYFGPKMRTMVEAVEVILQQHSTADTSQKSVLIHCWRGGMRSAGVAWLLDLYGFKVYTLAGGYKTYRNWVLQQFQKPYPLHIVGGYTGSGKTLLLRELAASGTRVIDLEYIARHKGSAFGGLGEDPQPTQEMFENNLAMVLHSISENATSTEPIWIEDESQRIGLINLPNAFWKTIRQSPVHFLDIPFDERLDYITSEYGKFNKEDLVNAVTRIQKRLGGINTKNAVNFLVENNYKESFRILLHYYDKYYAKDLRNRSGCEIVAIPCVHVDAKENSNKIKQMANGTADTGI